MSVKKDPDKTGRDYYTSLYKVELEKEAVWLKLSAPEKVNSIEYFLKRNAIVADAVLELGCGTGAVIQECQKRNLCKKYVAVDYSLEALEYLKKHTNNIETIAGDITSENFCLETAFDIVILSHVLEHLEEPAKFLKSIIKQVDFDNIVIEVPLEDLPIRRIRDRFRDRRMNTAGHVQFFTIDAFEKLLVTNGFEIKDRLRYLPILDLSTLDFVSKKNKISKFKYIIKILTNTCLPRLFSPLWKRLYYAHYAVLCCKVAHD